MKKMLVMLILGMFLISFVGFVMAENNSSSDNTSLSEQIRSNIQERQQIKNETKDLKEAGKNQTNFTQDRKELRREFVQNIHQRNEIRKDIRDMIKENGVFTYVDENGTSVNFTKVDGQLRLGDRRHEVKTDLNLTIDGGDNETILTVSDGNKTKTIKIMPDTAAERAIQRLSLKNCNTTNNCTIELKDVGANKIQKIAYELQIERHYKLFGLFSAKAENKATVDADTGDVTVKQPWWSFLATKQN